MLLWDVPSGGHRAHSHDIPRTQKGPHPFPAGPCPNFSQTLRAFFDDFLIVFAIFLASGPNVDVAVSGSHTSTNLPSQETSFRLTQRCFRRYYFETPSPRQGQYQMCRNLWIHHSFVARGALSPCSRNSWALDSAAFRHFWVNGPHAQRELGPRLNFFSVVYVRMVHSSVCGFFHGPQQFCLFVFF